MSSYSGSCWAQLDGDAEHALGEERHPRRAVGLLEVAAGRQRRAAVEDADVVEAEEAALEHVAPGRVLAVDPPREVDEQLLEGALQPGDVALAALFELGLVDEQRRPGVHRRVDVAEVPLVRRQLAARVQVQLAQHQLELRLGEVDVDHARATVWKARSHDAYHGYSHVSGIEITSSLTMWNQLRLRTSRAVGVAQRVDVVLLEPAVEVEEVVLLAPQHPGQRLAHHRRRRRASCSAA